VLPAGRLGGVVTDIRTENVAQIREFLTMLEGTHAGMGPGRDGWAHRSVEGFVLAHGEPFDASPRPPGVWSGEKKLCFFNARELTRRQPGLTYVEGFAVSVAGLPMLHAWTVDASGRVLDPTWDWGEGDMPAEEAGALLGVRFPSKLVDARWMAGDGVSLLDCWELEWPLLRHGWDQADPEAAIAAFRAAGRAFRARRAGRR
jgi:hypothetical protein